MDMDLTEDFLYQVVIGMLYQEIQLANIESYSLIPA
jgi:hypothetical protein